MADMPASRSRVGSKGFSMIGRERPLSPGSRATSSVVSAQVDGPDAQRTPPSSRRPPGVEGPGRTSHTDFTTCNDSSTTKRHNMSEGNAASRPFSTRSNAPLPLRGLSYIHSHAPRRPQKVAAQLGTLAHLTFHIRPWDKLRRIARTDSQTSLTLRLPRTRAGARQREERPVRTFLPEQPVPARCELHKVWMDGEAGRCVHTGVNSCFTRGTDGPGPDQANPVFKPELSPLTDPTSAAKGLACQILTPRNELRWLLRCS